MALAFLDLNRYVCITNCITTAYNCDRKVVHSMTKVQFDHMMSVGLEQAKAGDSFDADDVFAEIERRLG